MKKTITALGLTTLLLLPTTTMASEQLWTNPTEYHSLPSGLVYPIGDANKSEDYQKVILIKLALMLLLQGVRMYYLFMLKIVIILMSLFN
jgi:hypothetical protein